MQTNLPRLVAAFFVLQIILASYTACGQCSGRYLDTIFEATSFFSDIPYTTSAGGSTTELMDIYQPGGDSACLRHLIIWVHGGAFFQGTKNDGDMEFLCQRFARRGYVCASINYRLAPSIVALYDSSQIFMYAYQASADIKAAIRYFYKDATLANHWNVDTNAIFIGGSSAGGIAADFTTTIDSVSELVPSFQTIANNNGGIKGNSGNAGYSTKVIASASLAGAVHSLSWIKSSTPPMVLCQGTADGTVPYDCGLALTQYTLGLYPTINLCGSGQMASRMDSVGVRHSTLPFVGSGHVPWDTNTVIANRMDSAVAAFFYSVNCIQATGRCNELLGIPAVSTPKITIYPNPVSDHLQITIHDQNELLSATLYDYTSRVFYSSTLAEKAASISLPGLSPGIYILQIHLRYGDITTITKTITIE